MHVYCLRICDSDKLVPRVTIHSTLNETCPVFTQVGTLKPIAHTAQGAGAPQTARVATQTARGCGGSPRHIPCMPMRVHTHRAGALLVRDWCYAFYSVKGGRLVSMKSRNVACSTHAAPLTRLPRQAKSARGIHLTQTNQASQSITPSSTGPCMILWSRPSRFNMGMHCLT